LSWDFEGTGNGIWFDISEYGHRKTYGMGSQTPRPEHGDRTWVKKIVPMSGGWNISNSEEFESSKHPHDQKLKAFFDSNNGKAVALLSYGDAGGFAPPLISCTILAAPTYCNTLYSLCRTIFGQKTSNYFLTADFGGFIDEGIPADPNIPTFKQFMDTGLPRQGCYLSSKVQFSFTSDCRTAVRGDDTTLTGEA
jgi:hypothetical protein